MIADRKEFIQRYRIAASHSGRTGCRAVLVVLLVVGCIAMSSTPAAADAGLPTILQGVGIDQNLGAGARIPPDLPFRDEYGHAVQIGDYFHDKPVILVLAYFRCPRLCNEVLNGLESGLENIGGMDIGASNSRF